MRTPLAVSLLLALVSACADRPPTQPSAVEVAVARANQIDPYYPCEAWMKPSSASIYAGDSTQLLEMWSWACINLEGTVYKTDPRRRIAWSWMSSDASIATAGTRPTYYGRATGVAPGTAMVSAKTCTDDGLLHMGFAPGDGEPKAAPRGYGERSNRRLHFSRLQSSVHRGLQMGMGAVFLPVVRQRRNHQTRRREYHHRRLSHCGLQVRVGDDHRRRRRAAVGNHWRVCLRGGSSLRLLSVV